MKYTIQYNGEQKYSYCLLDETNRVVNAFLDRTQAGLYVLMNCDVKEIRFT